MFGLDPAALRKLFHIIFFENRDVFGIQMRKVLLEDGGRFHTDIQGIHQGVEGFFLHFGGIWQLGVEKFRKKLAADLLLRPVEHLGEIPDPVVEGRIEESFDRSADRPAAGKLGDTFRVVEAERRARELSGTDRKEDALEDDFPVLKFSPVGGHAGNVIGDPCADGKIGIRVRVGGDDMAGKLLKDILIRLVQCPEREELLSLRIQRYGEELLSLCAGQALLQDILEAEGFVLVEGEEFPEGLPGEFIFRSDIERVDPVDRRIVPSDYFSDFCKIAFIHILPLIIEKSVGFHFARTAHK